MRVLCAPDKFKGSLTARQAAEAMARGVLRADPSAEVDLCPIADGGEGTVDAMLAATGGERRVSTVAGPLFEPVDAAWGLFDGKGSGVVSPKDRRARVGGSRGESIPDPLALTAVIEMAAASGVVLLPPPRRDPTRTTTLGTGGLIACALDAGARRMILGIGGSATNDGGVGMAVALGASFFDRRGIEMVEPIPTGGTLEQIARIRLELDPRLAFAEIVVACDVANPLTGPDGAARVYGPQKGATPEQVELLDRGLRHLAKLIREQLGKDIERVPGAGAAGGLGGGLMAFLGAKLRPGAELVLDAVAFDRRVAGCGLCLTGEGRLDRQSLSGKACLTVARAAARRGVPTIALVGSAGEGAEESLHEGLAGYRVIGGGLPMDESIRRAAELLESAAEAAVHERR